MHRNQISILPTLPSSQSAFKVIYNKHATVIHYPIDTSKFRFSDQKEDYYLVSSRLISYKRINLTIEAFNQLGLPLIIIGDGPEASSLKAMAASNIKFLGHVTDAERGNLMAKARFVVVAALEDYGLVPIEANVSGTPCHCLWCWGCLRHPSTCKTAVFFSRTEF